MEDDEELEKLLGEIPYATSFNLHHPHSNGHHFDHVGQCNGSVVTQKMNNVTYGMYDDDPLSHRYTCASPGSGFSLQSDGSSSSLFSGGHSFSLSDNGSPNTPPLEELKSQRPGGSPNCPSGLLLDTETPDSSVVKKANENVLDKVSLSTHLSRMNLSKKQEDVMVDPNGYQFCDRYIGGTNPYNFQKYGSSDDYMRSLSDCGRIRSSSPRYPFSFDGEKNSALLGLWHECRHGNPLGSQYSPVQSDGLFSMLNYGNSPMSSQYHRAMEEAAFHSLNVPQFAKPRPHFNVENMLHCHSARINRRTRASSHIKSPQGALEACNREDSLIIQGEGLNYAINKGHGRSSGQNNRVSYDIGLGKPQGKRPQLNAHPQFARAYGNSQSDRIYYPFSLPLQFDSLAEAQGYIHLIAKDQHGCRFLQRMFDEGGPQDVQIIFNEIIDNVVELMINPFGNYLMQKLLEVCNEEQRMQILLRVTEERGELIRISLNSHGTRVVQKLIQTLKTRQQISLVISALEPGLLALIRDLNGNHVVQRCLQCLTKEDNKDRVSGASPVTDRKFIFVAAAKHCVDIATHKHGCCVLQRCISHSTGQYHENLVTEISANGLLLSEDAFGNYVVQFILELKIPSATSKLISQFEGNYVNLSLQKFSSHVVEKCLTTVNDEVRAKIIHELLSAAHFEQLLQDPHANYVVQTALLVSEGRLHSSLVDAIESHKAISRNSPYSKRIFSHKLLKK
ncbi:unnamed protein product [Ilex paraguariensis]|uniref:PUM-HD domain-containing protein n=1 Tax=Ilex paraguariensis TaxID=185542 RepID=A0ABC8UKT3_9AQUA